MPRAALDALDALIRDNARTPYVFGTWDCAIFTFNAVAAQTGVDHFEAYRGNYTTYDSGVLLMKSLDRVPTVRALLTAKLGDPIPVAQALTGDVVFCKSAAGVMYGGRGLFLAEGSGYERAPRAMLERAWKVRA